MRKIPIIPFLIAVTFLALGVLLGYQFAQMKAFNLITQLKANYKIAEDRHNNQIKLLNEKLTASNEDAAYIASSKRVSLKEANLPFCSSVIKDQQVDVITLDYKGQNSTFTLIQVDDDTRIGLWQYDYRPGHNPSDSVTFILRGGEGPYFYPDDLEKYYASNRESRLVFGDIKGYYFDSYYPYKQPLEYTAHVITKPWVLPQSDKITVIEIVKGDGVSADDYRADPVSVKAQTIKTLDTFIDSLVPLPCK